MSLLHCTSLLEREYMSFLKGASRKAKFRPIFEALTPSKATATNNRLEQLGRQVAQPATSPNPKVSGPIVKGITKSLSAQKKIDARLAKVRQIKSPRAKLAALKNIKNDVVMSQNDEHRAQCEASRDQILNSMRERMSGQNA